MKNLLLTGLLALTGTSVMASFDHPCEIIYYEINKKNNTSGYTMEDFLTCKDQFGDTRLIRKAEKYKKQAEERLSEIERKVEESAAVARGERAGKIIKHFSLEDMIESKKNVLGVPYASYVWLADKDKTYETKPDIICGALGFDKALSSRQSQQFSSGSRDQLKDAPDRIFEFRDNTWSKDETIVHTLNKERPSRNTRMYFKYFTEITCEREIKAGETVQDFDLDMDAIMAAVEREVDAPDLDDDVRRILSLNPEVSNAGRKSSQDMIEGEREEEWTPTYNQNDFFIVTPK